ncbi:MAG: hypothetical protein GEV12_21670 [Micromonosporaceae bacterium]|nr:hypothetical protein [Micromonosporaceae bacterium]
MTIAADGATTKPGGRRVADPLRVEPSGGGRRARLSWVVLGVLIIAGCALVAAVWAGRVAERTPALALAREVERGQVLTEQDLAVVNVAVDGQLAIVGVQRGAQVVGRAAGASLPAGTLLTEQMVTTDPGLGPQDRVVGLALQPGEFPTAALTPGDEVMVIRTPAANAAGDGEAGGTVLVGSATVYAVDALGETSAGLLVSVVVDEPSAAPVASAAAQGRARLVLIGGGR